MESASNLVTCEQCKREYCLTCGHSNCSGDRSFESFMHSQLQNKSFRQAWYYDNRAITAWTLEKMMAFSKMTQAQLAKRMKTKQASISRAINNGCSFDFLLRASKATRHYLDIEIKELPKS